MSTQYEQCILFYHLKPTTCAGAVFKINVFFKYHAGKMSRIGTFKFKRYANK